MIDYFKDSLVKDKEWLQAKIYINPVTGEIRSDDSEEASRVRFFIMEAFKSRDQLINESNRLNVELRNLREKYEWLNKEHLKDSAKVNELEKIIYEALRK